MCFHKLMALNWECLISGGSYTYKIFLIYVAHLFSFYHKLPPPHSLLLYLYSYGVLEFYIVCLCVFCVFRCGGYCPGLLCLSPSHPFLRPNKLCSNHQPCSTFCCPGPSARESSGRWQQFAHCTYQTFYILSIFELSQYNAEWWDSGSLPGFEFGVGLLLWRHRIFTFSFIEAQVSWPKRAESLWGASWSEMTAGMIDEYMYWIYYFYLVTHQCERNTVQHNDYKPLYVVLYLMWVLIFHFFI